MLVTCVFCRSNHASKNGNRYTNVGLIQKYLCNNCGKSFELNGVYTKLSDIEKDKIKKLYASGKSAKAISKIMKRDRSVVQRYLKNNEPSYTKRSWKFSRTKIPKLVFNARLKYELGEFLGAFAGDGYMYVPKTPEHSGHYVMIFPSAMERAYAKHLSEISYKLFGRKPSIWLNKKYHYIFLRFGGKELQGIIKQYLYFNPVDKTHSIKLRQGLSHYTLDFIRGFAAGLVASDGSVSAGDGEIRFSVTSRGLAHQYVHILKRAGVHVRFYQHTHKHGFTAPYTMYLATTKGRRNVTQFYYKIGLTEPNRLRKLEKVVLNR